MVSCILVTANRRRYIARAVKYFLSQTYANRELVIYDSGEQDLTDLIPASFIAGVSIRYYKRPRKLPEVSVGELRNVACDLSAGDHIAIWDDDDFSAPWRIAEQMELLERDRAVLVGYNDMLFFDERTRPRPLWVYSAAREQYAVGTSMLFKRPLWYQNPYPAQDVAEDNAMLDAAGNRVAVMSSRPADPIPAMIARIHTSNVWGNKLNDRIKKAIEADPTGENVLAWTQIKDEGRALQIEGVLA